LLVGYHHFDGAGYLWLDQGLQLIEMNEEEHF
jgi:hypothetical protein